MIYITAIHLVGGSQHEHVGDVLWLNGQTGKSGESNTATMIDFIDKKNIVQVGGSDGPVVVGVVRPQGRNAYLRTYADKQWNDNLLALPRY